MNHIICEKNVSFYISFITQESFYISVNTQAKMLLCGTETYVTHSKNYCVIKNCFHWAKKCSFSELVSSNSFSTHDSEVLPYLNFSEINQ
jgi:hypothetical protein